MVVLHGAIGPAARRVGSGGMAVFSGRAELGLRADLAAGLWLWPSVVDISSMSLGVGLLGEKLVMVFPVRQGMDVW